MPAYYGLSFVEEAEKIQKLLETEIPLTVVLGGAKKDKLGYLSELVKISDRVLVGGKLPLIAKEPGYVKTDDSRVLWAGLKESGLDLSEKDIIDFQQIIRNSKTIVWAGAMGYYESEENKKGTNEIAQTIAETSAYKVIAGGDTSASIRGLGLEEKIDYICSGGGVMLEFLTKQTLPAWE
jgi:3-phosphoglycerate kinase